jgi:hypothetical protein
MPCLLDHSKSLAIIHGGNAVYTRHSKQQVLLGATVA